MQIRHIKSVLPPGESPNRITAMAWSPNGQKLAIAGADRVIQLFDETGERKDRFSTKSGDPKAPRSYNICGLAFSPDSTKLAVAQTDASVFVYKLGLDWGEKKSICNKFIQSCDVTCLAWPREQHNTLVFGLMDGKVRVGNLKTNKSATLYATESMVVSLTGSKDGNAVLSGHIDGTINRFYFDDGVSGASQGRFASHPCPPMCLQWGESIMVAGSDQKVVFYDNEGRVSQSFDYQRSEDNNADFTCAEVSPSGQSVVLGSFDKLYTFNFGLSRGQWEEVIVKTIDNLYTVTSLAWKPDGSRLCVANMLGSLDMFDTCIKRTKYRGKFEFTYISPSQVIVKRLSTGARIVLKSHYSYEVTKINIFRDQFLVAHTSETVLLGDLVSCKLSEIPWHGSGQEKFYFDNPQVCMVFNAGELSLIEYGVNEILGSCRTEHMSPHLISVRLNERRSDTDIKRVAYLVDLQTIQVLDLTRGVHVAQIAHDVRIDWLELSGKGEKLLFRDKRHQLHLYDIHTQTRSTLVHYCTYVQWVPGSDVVVAQSRGNLCIWYSIDSPERVTMFPIKGEVEDIERVDGKTEVIVDEGVNTVSYTLDEGLIEFGSALDDRDYERAVALLETLEMTSETEAMWKSLSSLALKDRKLVIAERCFAALGDVSKRQYLHDLNVVISNLSRENPGEELRHYAVRAKLAILDKQFKVAESIYLEQGKIEEAMDMYQQLHRWDASIKVAESRNHPDLDTLKRNYLQWLLESGQEERAASLKEDEGDYLSAINLYLKGGMPGRAAYLLLKHSLNANHDLTERIAAALYKTSLYEKAGELYESLGSNERALDSYRRGKAFRAAVELCRLVFPTEVVRLEEQWGDHLVAQKQVDGAVNHYIEAGKLFKAIDACIAVKQWKKAVSIVDSLQPPESGRPYFSQLATHFQEINDYALAEKYLVLAGRHQEAVEMYTKANLWEKAHSLATSFMSPEDVAVLYITRAKDMEAIGKLKDAEKLYLTVQEPDMAINMYKNHKQYDQMIRLVTAYHRDLLSETHLYLGKTLENEGNLRQAEHHYLEGKDWKSAINMYCTNNMYEEAYRVAKTHGGSNSAKQVAYLWARSLGGESAVKLLTKFNLLDAAIDFATENGAFEFAFELSRFADKYKLADVHNKHAMYLEDEGKFKEAEAAFVLAGKPREAILMYIHNEDWDAALRVAEAYEPSSAGEVLLGQAKLAFSKGEFAKGEALVLRAQRPELAVKLYKDSNNWKEAIRFAKEYLPSKLSEVHEDYDRYLSSQADAGKDHIVNTAKQFEQQKEYARAIDMYLKLTSNHTTDLDFLEEKWEKAVELAMKFMPERGQDVVSAACARLLEIKRFETAGDLFMSVELYKDAIDAYAAGHFWDKAKSVLKYAPKYGEYVDSLYVKDLKSKGQADALVNMDVVAGLDLYVSRGEWDKCLETASTQGKDVLAKYLFGYVSLLIKDKKFDTAAGALLKYNAPAPPANAGELYSYLARALLRNYEPASVAILQKILFKLIYGVGVVPQPSLAEKYGQPLMMSHFINLRNNCLKKKELGYFAAKLSISLLRYTQAIPADRAFYEAGRTARAVGMNNMAFVCWNRFLDLSDAIEEGNLSMLENTDFQNTDVPFDVELPKEAMEESIREEVRDWVLQISLDQKVAQEVDRRDCEQCQTSIYDACLTCRGCKTKWEPCIVTGYPVLKSSVKCTSCNKPANKDDWNKYVMQERVCPWCNASQAPIYFTSS